MRGRGVNVIKTPGRVLLSSVYQQLGRSSACEVLAVCCFKIFLATQTNIE